MRGTNHVIAGAGLLLIGRAVVKSAQSFEIGLPGFINDGLPQNLKTHVLEWVEGGNNAVQTIAARVYEAFSLNHPPWMIALGFGLFLIGTLLPDIDLPHSLLGRFMPWGIRWAKLRGGGAQSPLAHRGWTHTLWAILITIGIGIWIQPVGWWLVAGVVTHIFLDSFSAAGWVWYYPLLPSRWRVATYGDTRIVVSIIRHPLGVLKYSAQSPAIEYIYLGVIVVSATVLTWVVGL